MFKTFKTTLEKPGLAKNYRGHFASCLTRSGSTFRAIATLGDKGICCWMKLTLWVPLLRGFFCWQKSRKMCFFQVKGRKLNLKLAIFWIRSCHWAPGRIGWAVHTRNDLWLPDFLFRFEGAATVDVWNPAPVEVGSLSHHLRRVLYIQTVVFSPDFWTIPSAPNTFSGGIWTLKT